MAGTATALAPTRPAASRALRNADSNTATSVSPAFLFGPTA